MEGMFVGGKRKSIGSVKKIDKYLSYEQELKIWEMYQEMNNKIALEFFNTKEELFFSPKLDKCSAGYKSELLENSIIVMAGSLLEMDKKLEKLSEQILDKQQEIDAMKSGYSWRLTAPLRKIKRLFRKVKKCSVRGNL